MKIISFFFCFLFLIFSIPGLQASNSKVGCLYTEDPIKPYKILSKEKLAYLNDEVKLLLSEIDKNQKDAIMSYLEIEKKKLNFLRTKNLQKKYWEWHRIYVDCDSDSFHYLWSEKNKNLYLMIDFLIKLTQEYRNIDNKVIYDVYIKSQDGEDELFSSTNRNESIDRIHKTLDHISKLSSSSTRYVEDKFFEKVLNFDKQHVKNVLLTSGLEDSINIKIPIQSGVFDGIDLSNHWKIQTMKFTNTFFKDEYERVKTIIWNLKKRNAFTDLEPFAYWDILLQNFSVWSYEATKSQILSSAEILDSSKEFLSSSKNLDAYFVLKPWNATKVKIYSVDNVKDIMTYEIDYNFLKQYPFLLTDTHILLQINILKKWIETLDCDEWNSYTNKYIKYSTLEQQVQSDYCISFKK